VSLAPVTTTIFAEDTAIGTFKGRVYLWA